MLRDGLTPGQTEREVTFIFAVQLLAAPHYTMAKALPTIISPATG